MNLLIENLVVYNKNGLGIYRGIYKAHFPKWDGWGMLDRGEPKEVIDLEVLRFYETFFYYSLGLDQLQNQVIACAIMNFATMHGKKKALQKLQKVTESQAIGTDLIDTFNSQGKCSEYHLLLEFLEFYSFTGDISKVDWLTKAYRCL